MFSLFLFYLISKGPIPAKIFLNNGQWIANESQLIFKGDALQFTGSNGGLYRLPLRHVDIVRSYGQAYMDKRDKQPKRESFIPWTHPQFKDKQKGKDHLSLTTKGLKNFVEKKPYQPNLELEKRLRPKRDPMQEVSTGGRKR